MRRSSVELLGCRSRFNASPKPVPYRFADYQPASMLGSGMLALNNVFR
jgi:hypothetical protein